MSRAKKGSPFSLFAFQDAITSVCGVVVLVTLILALQLTHAALDDSRQIENAKTARELKEQIDSLRKDLERAKSPSASTEFIEEAAGMSLAEVERRLAAAQKRYDDAKKEREDQEEARDELEKRAKDAQQTKAENEELERKIEETKDAQEEALEEMKEGNDRGVVYQFPNGSSITPWFVDISKDRIIATSRDERKTFVTRDAFLSWAKSRPSSSEYFVLISRPSGSEAFRASFEALTNGGYQLGVDFVGERKELEFLPEENEGNDAT